MRSRLNSRALFQTPLVVAVVAAGAAIGLNASRGASAPPPPVPNNAIKLSVGSDLAARAIQPGFVGLSVEFYGIEGYTGHDPNAIDPVFVQLTRNLAPDQRFVLRIGGDSTDWTWWPVPGMAKPPGIKLSLNGTWMNAVRAFATKDDARLILGVNLEANSTRLSSLEANKYVQLIGKDRISQLELGNEPELYSGFAYYTSADGSPVHGRAPGYDIGEYTSQFAQFSKVLPKLSLAGPATGAPKWREELSTFLGGARRVGAVTIHRYPLVNCYTQPGQPQYPTLPHLLSSYATTGLANGVRYAVQVAHAHGAALRVDELNSVACSGHPGLSDTFASALWVLDTLPALARVGVDGVNVHTFPTASYAPFEFRQSHGVWTGSVRPLYYGLLMFTQAAPPGSRLLGTSWGVRGQIRTWATRAPDGTTHVVLTNYSQSGTREIAIRVPGASGDATVERLWAPFLLAKHHVTLGGQSFGTETKTGLLAGKPNTASVSPSKGGYYVVRLTGSSAAMLTLPPAS
jgi:hypothetical protein